VDRAHPGTPQTIWGQSTASLGYPRHRLEASPEGRAQNHEAGAQRDLPMGRSASVFKFSACRKGGNRRI